MKDKQTLFEYLYQNLKKQIISGRLPYGASLPSMTSLSELYHVGIRTVKDVLRTLKEEGYIRTEERKSAVVIYDQTGQKYLTAIRSILECKSSILAVYETLAALMPYIFAISARNCPEDRLKFWAGALERSKKRDMQSRWKTCASFLYTILENSSNLLFRDLFVSLEVYARLPFFQNFERYLELVSPQTSFQNTAWVMESLITGDLQEIEHRFGLMYRTVTRAVVQYLDELEAEHPGIAENPSAAYTWTAVRGRDDYYAQITRDLIDKIGIGLYREGSYLPSEAELARTYGVCVSTVRKALSMLNELGFGKTFNAKGTLVILQDEKSAAECMKNKHYRQDTLLYLSGLQLMAIAVRPAALLAFPCIGSRALEDLAQQMQEPGCIPLDCLVSCVIDHLPLQPLRHILQETKNVLVWGYYFSFFEEGHQGADTLTEKSLAAYHSLCQGDKKAFAAQLSDCYCHILEFVRAFIADFGLPEAGRLITPAWAPPPA